MTTTHPRALPPAKKIPPSDYRAILRLENRLPEPVRVNERYAAGRAVVSVPAEGYLFPWGVVVESRSGLSVVMDFHLEDLHAEFERKGRTATDLQERVFALLEELSGHTRRDNLAAWNPLAPGQDGWALVPGTLGKAAAFTALCHVNEEQAFREWLIADLLLAALPELAQRLYDELARQA